MDFWNDNIMYVNARKKWKMWIQKICQNSVKISKILSNAKFISEVHWNFPNMCVFNF